MVRHALGGVTRLTRRCLLQDTLNGAAGLRAWHQRWSPRQTALPQQGEVGGRRTRGLHSTIALPWFNPAAPPSIVTPFMFLCAIRDVLMKPMSDSLPLPCWRHKGASPPMDCWSMCILPLVKSPMAILCARMTAAARDNSSSSACYLGKRTVSTARIKSTKCGRCPAGGSVWPGIPRRTRSLSRAAACFRASPAVPQASSPGIRFGRSCPWRWRKRAPRVVRWSGLCM